MYNVRRIAFPNAFSVTGIEADDAVAVGSSDIEAAVADQGRSLEDRRRVAVERAGADLPAQLKVERIVGPELQRQAGDDRFKFVWFGRAVRRLHRLNAKASVDAIADSGQ